MKTSQEKVRSWLVELITQFREELENLSAEEQTRLRLTPYDLSYPCQVVVAWAREPEFQIFFFTYIDQLEDKMIEIHGPTKNSEFVEYLEKEFLNSVLIDLIGRGRVEDFLVNCIRDVRGYFDVFREVPKESIIKTFANISRDPRAVGWVVIGNLVDLEPRKVVDDLIQNIRPATKPSVTVATTGVPKPEERVVLEGFGTYIYPPVVIGEPPKPKSFGEKIMRFSRWMLPSFDRVVTDVYKQRPLVVTRDGFIAIGEKEKPKVVERLNEIMSILLVLDTPAYVVRENDLGGIRFTETGHSMSWKVSGLRSSLFPRPPSESMEILPMRRAVLPEEKMGKALKWAETLTSDLRLRTLLLLFLELYTHYMNNEYKWALVMGWIILEDFYIKDLWASEISKVPDKKDRHNKLGSWGVDRRLETLNIAHVLTNQEYDLLMKIKGARNDAVHEGKEPEKGIVDKCLELVTDVVQKYIGSQLGMRLSEL